MFSRPTTQARSRSATSAVADRPVLLRAIAGTAAGAVVTGGVLFLVGEDVTVYAWVLPAWMVVSLAAGPLFGVAVGQAGVTVLVALGLWYVATQKAGLDETLRLRIACRRRMRRSIGRSSCSSCCRRRKQQEVL
mgnify:CR=1 FL=1